MRRQRGFSLIETVVFIVIVAIAAVGLIGLFGQNARQSAEPLLRQKAVALASAYMDEILHKKWDHATPVGGGCVAAGSSFCLSGPPASTVLGPDSGESRSRYDDVDDYHQPEFQPPQNSDGEPLAGYAGFTVSVRVGHPAADWNGVARQDVKRVQVKVRTPLGETINLVAYRVNY